MGGRKDQYAMKIAMAIVNVARRRAGSRSALASKSGVDRGQLARVETGGVGLSWSAITMLARAVGMTPSALIAEAEALAAFLASQVSP